MGKKQTFDANAFLDGAGSDKEFDANAFLDGQEPLSDPFQSAPPASGEEGLGGPAASPEPSITGAAGAPPPSAMGGLRPFTPEGAAPRSPQMMAPRQEQVVEQPVATQYSLPPEDDPLMGTSDPRYVASSFNVDEAGAAAKGRADAMESVALKALKNTYGVEAPREGETASETLRAMTSYYDERFANLDKPGVENLKAINEKSSATVQQLASKWSEESKALGEAAKQLEQALPSMMPEEQQMAVNQFNASVERLNQRRGELMDMENAMVRDAQMLALREYDINKDVGSGMGVSALVIPKGIGRMTSGLTSFIIDGMTQLLPAEMIGPDVASGKMTRDQAAKEVKRMMLSDIRRGASEVTRKALDIGTTEEYYQDAATNGPFMAKAMIGLGESAPAMVSPYMTGIFFQTADAIGQEMEGTEYDDISELEKTGLKAALGVPAMLLERFGFRNLAKNSAVTKRILASAIGKLPANASAGQIQRVLDAETRSYLTNAGVRMLGGTLSEAETGGAQTAAEIGVRELYNEFKGKEILETPDTWVDIAYNIGEGAALEAAGGGALSIPSAIGAAMRTGSVTKDMDNKRYEAFEALLKDPDYPAAVTSYNEELVKAGKITDAEKQKRDGDLALATKIASMIPDDLPVNNRKQAYDLLLEREGLKKKDSILVAGKVAAINEKLEFLQGVSDAKIEAKTASVSATPAKPSPEPKASLAATDKPTFGEKPDKEADAPVWSSLSIGSVLTDSSDPNIHWVVVDDTTSKRSGGRIMSLAIVEKEADGTWTAGPPSIIVSVGADGTLRTDTSPRYSYTDASGNRNMAIMQPSDVSIPFGELIQEDTETGERFTPHWAKDMPKPAPTATQADIDAGAQESIQNWDRQNRNYVTDAWFEGAIASTDAFNRAAEVGGNRLGAHGMAKYGTLSGSVRALIDLLENNIDPNRGRGRLDTAPLALSERNAGSGAGTASGSSYRDGAFIIVQSAESSGSAFTDMSQAAAILVNEANIDQLDDIAAAIHAVRPDIIVAPYSMADQVTAQILGSSAKPAPTATQADIDAATGVTAVVEPVVEDVVGATPDAPNRMLSDFEVRPSPDNVVEVADANDLTITKKNQSVDVSELTGGVNLSDPAERLRVDKLKESILSDGGYVARLIVDGQGNVVEGQHRLEALRELGFDRAPVVRLTGVSDYIKDKERVVDAMRSAGVAKSDQQTQLMGLLSEIIADEAGDVSKLTEYDAPDGYESAWNAAVSEVIAQQTPQQDATQQATGGQPLSSQSLQDAFGYTKEVADATQADIDAATGKPAQGKKGKGPAQVPKAGQAKEQVTTPNENERTKRTETQPPTDTGTTASIPDAPAQVAPKKDVPAPAYTTRNRKFEVRMVDGQPKATPIVKQEDTWSSLPEGKLRNKERRRSDKAWAQAIRQAEDEYSEFTGAKIERKVPISKAREQEHGDILKKASQADDAELGPAGVALRQIAGIGLTKAEKKSLSPKEQRLKEAESKFNLDAVAKELGWIRNRNEGSQAETRYSEEAKNAKWAVDPKGKLTIQGVAHSMMENGPRDENGDPLVSEQEYRDAIIDVFRSHSTKTSAIQALKDLIPETPEERIARMQEEYERNRADGFTEEEEAAVESSIDQMTDEELDEAWQQQQQAEKATYNEDDARTDERQAAEQTGEVPTGEEEGGEAGQSEGEAESLTPEIPNTPIGNTKTVVVGGKKRTVFNSNGKPIHPTVEGVRNFWRWFGDSKVVDAEGRPLVVYHGTNTDFDVFDPSIQKHGRELGDGVYFTADKARAENYGGRVVEAYLSIQDPFSKKLHVRDKSFLIASPELTDFVRQKRKENAKNGVPESMGPVVKKQPDGSYVVIYIDGLPSRNNSNDGVISVDENQFVAFSPTQIKSATGNYGTFDPANESIFDEPTSLTAEDRKSLSDRIFKLADDLEKGLEGMVGAFPIPPQIAVSALRAVATAVKAGETLSRAIAKGLKELRQSDWYKGLSGAEKSQAEAEFTAPIKAMAVPVDRKPSTAPKKIQKQVNEQQSGLAPRKKILVDEKAALRDQILMAARVAKEAARSGAIAGEIHGRREERSAAAKAAEKARKEADMAAQKRTDQGYSFGLAEGRTAGEIAGKREGRKEGAKEAIDRIKEARKAFDRDVALALGGKGLDLSLVQSRSIARAAAKVDPSNDMQVSRFINYAMKVVENADWADQVAKARSAKRKAQAAARNKKLALNHREALQAAADVDVNLIDDPVVYTDAVRRYLAATAPTTTERYAPADTKAMLDLMEKLQGQVQKAYKELLKEEYGIDDVGELSAKELYDALAAEDIDDFAANLDAAKRQELEERVAKMAEYRKLSLQGYQNADITADQQKMLAALKGANIDRMNLQQQADYIRYADNILTNDVFYGAAYAAAIAENSVQIGDALAVAAKNPVKRLFSKDAAKVFMSQSDAFRFFFGMRPVAAQIQNRMGVGDFIRGKKKWANQSKELGKKMTDFYNALRKKYKNTYNEGLMTAEGMVSFAIQNVPGQDPKTSLSIRKAIIEQDIKLKQESRGALAREGEVAEIVYNEILRDAKTYGEVMNNLKGVYPAAYESVEFLKSVSRPYRDAIKQHTADTWNVGGDYSDPNYIPIRLPNAPNSQAPLSPDGPRNITRPTLRPKQAKGTIERQKYRGLPAGKMIDYNVRHNTFSALSDDLYDLNTSQAQMRVSEFMKMPDANTVFGSRENASFISEMLQKFMVAQYQTNDEESKYVNAVANTLRSWATVRALGGVLQVAKQLPEAFMQATTILNGRADRMFTNMMRVGQATELLDKYAIGDRAGIQGGSRWEGAVKRHTSELEAAFRNNTITRIKANITEKIGQALMASLSASDSLAAKGAWMALYEQERGRQGHAVTSWAQEAREHDNDQQRKDAALYAESMVDQVMVSSDPAKMADIAKKGTEGGKNLVKAVLLPFSSFAMQAASRRTLDLSELYSYGKLKAKGDPKAADLEPGAAARSLLASTIGTATFLASSIYVVGFLRDALGELWDDAFDDDEEGTENLIFATTVLQAMYMMGIMDVDIFRSAQKGQQRRLSYEKSKDKENFEQTEAEKKRVRNMKMFMTRLGTEQIPYLNALQPASDGVVDFLNKMQYNTLVENNDPSVRNKDGSVKKFESWQKDPANTMLYRMGQGWDKDRVPLGMIDVLLQNKEAAMRQYNLLQKTSDENAAKAAAPKKPKVEATSRFR
jgi:hypothetical protein